MGGVSVPNFLAITRLVLTPIAMGLILAAEPVDSVTVAAAIVFAVAALTDLLDGYLARRWRITTTFGAFLDTVADKVLVSGALLALVAVEATSIWFAFLIIGREIAIMGLRSVAALDQSTVPPSIWGKSKAVVQFIAITLAILRFEIVLGPWRLDQWVMGAAVIVTLLSAGDYFSRFRAALTPRAKAP
jgi:CDP-diacylglycerol---glycerol-3-phosphate 3-phosphatidyltransferase